MARMLGRAGDRDEMLRQYRAAARLAPTLDQDTALAELAREELRAAEPVAVSGGSEPPTAR